MFTMNMHKEVTGIKDGLVLDGLGHGRGLVFAHWSLKWSQ